VWVWSCPSLGNSKSPLPPEALQQNCAKTVSIMTESITTLSILNIVILSIYSFSRVQIVTCFLVCWMFIECVVMLSVVVLNFVAPFWYEIIYYAKKVYMYQCHTIDKLVCLIHTPKSLLSWLGCEPNHHTGAPSHLGLRWAWLKMSY